MTRVYLLDDHAIVREGLRAVLEASGMQVVGEADNIGQGLAEIVACVPDVVLLDLGLPERSDSTCWRNWPRKACPRACSS